MGVLYLPWAFFQTLWVWTFSQKHLHIGILNFYKICISKFHVGYAFVFGGIVDTLNNLLEKASSQLDVARKTDTADLHNFQMQKQSLVDEIEYAKKELEEVKKVILM